MDIDKKGKNARIVFVSILIALHFPFLVVSNVLLVSSWLDWSNLRRVYKKPPTVRNVPNNPSMSSSATFTTSNSLGSAAGIEAQQLPLTPPTPVMTRTIAASHLQPRLRDPLEDIFGASSTHDSRHDNRRQSLTDMLPPPYAEEAAIPLPEYTLYAPEPVTLAMYLFKFGFLFPPFWFFGSIILLSPLREPPVTSDEESSIPAWMPEKTEEERQKIIADIRRVELKWARRCLFAFITLAVLVTTGSIAAWLLLRR